MPYPTVVFKDIQSAVRWKGHCTYYLELQKAKLAVFSVLKEMVFVGLCMQSTLRRESDLGENPVCGNKDVRVQASY